MATDNRVVGVVLPPTIYRFIEDDLKGGEYASVSDWVRIACREYYEKRKRERSGGGAQYLIKTLLSKGAIAGG